MKDILKLCISLDFSAPFQVRGSSTKNSSTVQTRRSRAHCQTKLVLPTETAETLSDGSMEGVQFSGQWINGKFRIAAEGVSGRIWRGGGCWPVFLLKDNSGDSGQQAHETPGIGTRVGSQSNPFLMGSAFRQLYRRPVSAECRSGLLFRKALAADSVFRQWG